MDREAQDPIALLDEIQDKLQLDTAPLYWPAASGQRFSGMLDLQKQEFCVFERKPGEAPRIGAAERIPGDEATLKAALDESVFEELSEGAEMATTLLPEFDIESFLGGHMTPVVFGSALPVTSRSPASSSRSRRTWTRTIGTGLPSCGSALASSSAACALRRRPASSSTFTIR